MHVWVPIRPHGTRVENGLYRGERVRSVLVAIEQRNGSVSQTSYDRDRVFRTREKKRGERVDLVDGARGNGSKE